MAVTTMTDDVAVRDVGSSPWRRLLRVHEFGVLVATAVIFLYCALFVNHFLTSENLLSVAQQIAFIGIIGTGMTLLAGRYRSPLTISFQAIRASLFANAMATSFGGLRAMISFSHGQERVSRRRISAITAVAPATKTVRNMASPARVITPSLFFPAVE